MWPKRTGVCTNASLQTWSEVVPNGRLKSPLDVSVATSFMKQYPLIQLLIHFFIDTTVPPSVVCQKSVGQAPNFEVDAYMECYANGYPAPRLSWYKEVDPNNPSALILLTEKTFKYKFEATIPEPDVCTDCILARITVINVISGDYGTYKLRATSEAAIGHMSEGKVRLYQTPECQQSITNPDNKGCRSPPKIAALNINP